MAHKPAGTAIAIGKRMNVVDPMAIIKMLKYNKKILSMSCFK
jgi:hypothetical protein